MIPLTFFYDEYINWPELSEQKKTFEFIFPPRKWGRNKKHDALHLQCLTDQSIKLIFNRSVRTYEKNADKDIEYLFALTHQNEPAH